MPSLKIATWNINSVRLRIGLVERFLEEHRPDVLCLQETKTPDANFPSNPLAKLGYRHQAVSGQKGYHGVAIVSRRSFRDVERRGFCSMGDARHIAATLDLPSGPITVHSLYVPAGGDEPDPSVNPKFAHKLQFLDEMEGWIGRASHPVPSILVGDLNVAPLEEDVWSHRQMLKIVSHTPAETERFEKVRRGGDWIDVMRRFVPETEKLYTWWSYRSADWAGSDRGRRLDHVWASPHFDRRLEAMAVLKEARGWEKPSDHVPVIATFEV